MRMQLIVQHELISKMWDEFRKRHIKNPPKTASMTYMEWGDAKISLFNEKERKINSFFEEALI